MNLVVIEYNKNLTLVDTGFYGCINEIEELFNKNNLEMSNLTHIVITHHDMDHIGSLNQIIEKYPTITTIASRIESEYIEGTTPSPRASGKSNKYIKEMFSKIPSLKSRYNTFSYSKIDIKIDNDQYFEELGLTILFTVGHTPGHISVITNDNTFITGDALTCENNILKLPSKRNTLDFKVAVESLNKLQNYKIEKIICYHGGLVNNNVEKQIHQLIEN